MPDVFRQLLKSPNFQSLYLTTAVMKGFYGESALIDGAVNWLITAPRLLTHFQTASERQAAD